MLSLQTAAIFIPLLQRLWLDKLISSRLRDYISYHIFATRQVKHAATL